MKEKLERCDLEISITKRYTHGFRAIYNAMGELDWLIEKQMIKEEHMEPVRCKICNGQLAQEVCWGLETIYCPACRKKNTDGQIYMEGFVYDALRTEPDPTYAAARERLQDPRTVRLLHVALGLATEAGEFVDTLKRHIYYGKPIDRVNLLEELGDTSWYERLGVNALEASYAEMLLRNVSKLKARFPEKFTEAAAVNRDLTKEREALKGGANDH